MNKKHDGAVVPDRKNLVLRKAGQRARTGGRRPPMATPTPGAFVYGQRQIAGLAPRIEKSRKPGGER